MTTEWHTCSGYCPTCDPANPRVISGLDAVVATPEPVAPPPPARPSRVEVGQRLRFGRIEYAVIEGPNDEGKWSVKWECGDESPLWLMPKDILCDEFLGLAAPAETPPGSAVAPAAPAPPEPVKPKCPECEGLGWSWSRELPDQRYSCSLGCEWKARPNPLHVPVAAAPATGVGEDPRELTFAEAMRLLAQGQPVECWARSRNEWEPVPPLTGTTLLNVAKVWATQRYRRPEPLPAPAPRVSRVQELLAIHLKRDSGTVQDYTDVVKETLKAVRETYNPLEDVAKTLDRARAAMLDPPACPGRRP